MLRFYESSKRACRNINIDVRVIISSSLNRALQLSLYFFFIIIRIAFFCNLNITDESVDVLHSSIP
ncbi:hypothetical protein O3M35_012182 [Rhynocoris fuscipes]|uniref:Uncharacterized protein n=1 Tax=Rhynocoris fuscipes TaxID=488301 RepID=A0AAW1CSP1_9HEMI